jgi:hypothetical protein
MTIPKHIVMVLSTKTRDEWTLARPTGERAASSRLEEDCRPRMCRPPYGDHLTHQINRSRDARGARCWLRTGSATLPCPEQMLSPSSEGGELRAAGAPRGHLRRDDPLPPHQPRMEEHDEACRCERRLRAPSPALVISLIALFVALAGIAASPCGTVATGHSRCTRRCLVSQPGCAPVGIATDCAARLSTAYGLGSVTGSYGFRWFGRPRAPAVSVRLSLPRSDSGSRQGERSTSR